MPTQQIYTQDISQKPLVSFIIPTYNLPSTLLMSCLDSIMKLTLDNHEREVIVIDDGSATPIITALTAYQDRIIYIRQNNQGAAAARNMGLRIAQGRYIQFVDGDDMLIPFVYEHCLDIARYRDADIVVFDYTHQQKQQTICCDMQEPITGCQYMLRYNLQASVWRLLFKRDILQGLRFTKALLNEDEEFTPQLLLNANKLFVTHAKAYYYRKRANSCTTSNSTKTLLNRLSDTLKILLKFQEQLDRLPPMERRAMQRRIAQLTMDYIYNVARYTHSLKHVNKAINTLTGYALYPLPDKRYTKKYILFRKLIKNNMGRRVLILLGMR